MRKAIIFGWLLLAASCTSAQVAERKVAIPSPTPAVIVKESEETTRNNPTVKVGNFILKLEDCRLTYQDKGETRSFSFPFTAPCQFSKNEKGEMRLVKVKKDFVIAVESSHPRNNTASGNVSTDCETSIRGVIVSKNSVKLSAQTQKVAMCLPFVWDEKMFQVFAFKPEPFPE